MCYVINLNIRLKNRDVKKKVLAEMFFFFACGKCAILVMLHFGFKVWSYILISDWESSDRFRVIDTGKLYLM